MGCKDEIKIDTVQERHEIDMEGKITKINCYFLKELTFEITKKCPMRCILCSSNGGSPYDKEFNFEEIKQIIDDSIDLGTTHINLSGGEPLIHPDIINICKYVKEKKLSLDIYSCGNSENKNGKITPITKNMFSKLKKTGVDKLIFSIHGDKADVHDYITAQPGSYSNLIKSIENAVEKKFFVELHFVPTRQNYKTLPNVMKLADSLKVKRLSVLRFVPQGRGWINKEVLEIKSEKLIDLKNILHTIRKEYSATRFRAGSPFNCFHLKNNTSCNAGIDKATIKADGSVYPCVSMKDFYTDTNDNVIWYRSLSNIWNNSVLFNIARSSLQIIQDESPCNRCIYFSECHGGCLTQRLIKNKLEEKDPYCLMTVSDYLEKVILAH